MICLCRRQVHTDNITFCHIHHKLQKKCSNQFSSTNIINFSSWLFNVHRTTLPDSRSEIVFLLTIKQRKEKVQKRAVWIEMYPHIVYIMCVNHIKWMLFQIQISTCLSTHQNCRRSVKWGLACIHYAGRAWWRGGQRSPAPASGIKEVLSALLPQPACEGEHQHR